MGPNGQPQKKSELATSIRSIFFRPKSEDTRYLIYSCILFKRLKIMLPLPRVAILIARQVQYCKKEDSTLCECCLKTVQYYAGGDGVSWIVAILFTRQCAKKGFPQHTHVGRVASVPSRRYDDDYRNQMLSDHPTICYCPGMLKNIFILN